ncbi:hypothetical protein Taro_034990 [Colocasia esculenta]|uniref:Uncharacterized protein n=1 Tax=Colocasia esculenta TaxID=4460 RepID=A0A843W2G5_COLES|nr:hypothetical protein [Colocasia esculenta]
MESSVGSIIFERFARVIGRIKVQKGCLIAFPRFLFREYHQGHLFTLNEAQAREGKPAVSPATFLDMNSIHLVNDPFKVWEERYKVRPRMNYALKRTGTTRSDKSIVV